VKQADRSLKPTKKLEEYCGIYGGDLYGNAEVRQEGDGLVLDFLPSEILVGELDPLSCDTFLVKICDMPYLPEGTVRFYLDEHGSVTEMKVDIPNPDFDFTEIELIRLSD
jgi:hypothetical protein